MRKKLSTDEILTRAKKREIKKRPRMQIHGAALKNSRHGAGAIIKAAKD